MEQDAVIEFVELAPDIIVPCEWPVCRVHRIVLNLAKEIIDRSDYDDPVLQVNGIPAKMHRYVDQQGFFYVFQKIPHGDMHGSYVYDITWSEDRNNNKMKHFSRTNGESRPSNCSCAGNYTVSCYQLPPRINKRKAADISTDETKVKRMYQRILDECVSHD